LQLDGWAKAAENPDSAQGQAVALRIEQALEGLSTHGLLVIDAKDKLGDVSRNISGLSDLVERKALRAAASSGVPKELDETAYVDGYSFPSFFIKIFLPTISAGIGVAAFFCFMFSWVEMLLAKNLTSVAAKPIVAAMTKTASTSGYELGLLAAAGVLTLIPGAIVIYFVRNYIAKGFALGRV
jgi:hypothetical protein